MNEPRIEDRQPTLTSRFAPDESPVGALLIDELVTLQSDLPHNATSLAVDRLSTDSESVPEIPGYEILGKLGQGGMGVVYRALHLELKRPVALKILRHADRPADLHRFRREAELTARLLHPHIVQVYEVGSFRSGICGSECPYIAFELVDGGCLDHLLRESILRPTEAALLLRTLAQTLQVVHDQGIVHRDLKPANVLLAFGHVPKISDFGLACLHEEVEGRLTRPGQLLGTPGYMAPEQVDGLRRTIGPATDIHALGAILYECLTGRSPYKGASLHETLAMICGQEAVPVRRLRSDVPRDLETICLKCLEKEPACRYASASELADDLARFLDGRPILARRISLAERMCRWYRRQPLLGTLSAMCVLLCMVLFAGVAWHITHLAAIRSEAETAREVAATQEYYALLHATRERAMRREIGWTQTGLNDIARAATLRTRVVDHRALRGEAARCLSGIDLRPARTIAIPINASRMAFHPCSSMMALGEAKGWLACSVILVDLASGKVVRRLSLPSRRCWDQGRLVQDGVKALAFSPDGTWLVAGTRTGWLHRWNLTNESTRIESWAAHVKTITDLLFTSSGDGLVSAAEDQVIRRWSIHDGWKQSHQVSLAGRMSIGCVPESLMVVDQQIHTLSQKDLRPAVPPLPVPGHLVRACAGGPLFVASGTALHVVDSAGGRRTQDMRSPGMEDAHRAEIDFIECSHDSTALVSASQQTRRVRVWEIASGRMMADLPVGEPVCQVAFAPRQRTLAVLTGHEVRLHELGGGDVQTFACQHSWPVLAFAWLRDDKGMACLSGDRGLRQGELTLWAAPASANTPRWRAPVTLPISRLPVRLHADAHDHIAWTAGDRLNVMRADQPAQKWSAKPGEIHSLAFAPDGRLWVAAGCKVEARSLPGLKIGRSWDNSFGDMLSGLGTLYAVAPGGRQVLVGGRDGNLRLLDARTAESLQRWKICTTPLCSVALSGDEQWGAAGTSKGGIHLVRLATGEKIDFPDAHLDRVKTLAFFGNGMLASGSADQTIRLWQWEDDTLQEWLTIHTGRAVKAVVPSANGARLAVLLQGDRAVRIWDLQRLRDRLAELGLE